MILSTNLILFKLFFNRKSLLLIRVEFNLNENINNQIKRHIERTKRTFVHFVGRTIFNRIKEKRCSERVGLEQRLRFEIQTRRHHN